MDESDPALETLVAIVESGAGVDFGVSADPTADPDVPVDPDQSADADPGPSNGGVTLVRRGDRPEPTDEVWSHLAGAGSIVGVIPRIDPSLVDRLTATDAPGVDARIVLTGRAAERVSGATGAAVGTAMAERGVTLSVHGGDSPVVILLVDDRAVVGMFDGSALAAALTTDRPGVREWAAETCRRYIAAADPI